MRMGLQNKFNGRSTKGIKCKGLCDNTKERRNSQLVVR